MATVTRYTPAVRDYVGSARNMRRRRSRSLASVPVQRTTTVFATGYRDNLDRFVAWGVSTDRAEAESSAKGWTSNTVEGVAVGFSGLAFLVLVIEKPVGWQAFHPLDVPTVVNAQWSEPDRLAEALSRQVALDRCYLENSRRADDDPSWSIVIEVGQVVDVDLESMIEMHDGAGLQCVQVFRPVRVVRATQFERNDRDGTSQPRRAK